jgi:hypothetical protein
MFVTSSSKYSIGQKLFSKLTSISPRKTQDNLQINIQTRLKTSSIPDRKLKYTLLGFVRFGRVWLGLKDLAGFGWVWLGLARFGLARFGQV